MINKNNFKPAAIFVAMIVFILNSSQVISGAKSGLMLCFSKVIPSLFPFMILSSLFVGNTGAETFGIISRITNKIFGISPHGTAAFICGILCGYPIGAKCACELYKENKISSSEAESLIAYTNNCGPLFIIGAVGTTILKSFKLGVFLYIVHISASLLTAVIMKKHTYIRYVPNGNCCNSKKLTECICQSIPNILNVCGFVIFFAVVNNLLDNSLKSLPITIKGVALCITEITNGIGYICNFFETTHQKLLLTAISLSWAGISVHMQVINIVAGTGLKLKKYFFARILTAGLSGIAVIMCYDKPDLLIYHLSLKSIGVLLWLICLLSAGIIIVRLTKRIRQV